MTESEKYENLLDFVKKISKCDEYSYRTAYLIVEKSKDILKEIGEL